MDPGPLVDDLDLFRSDRPLVELYSVVIASWGHNAQLLTEVKPLQGVGQLPSGRPRALSDGVVVEGDRACGKQKRKVEFSSSLSNAAILQVTCVLWPCFLEVI